MRHQPDLSPSATARCDAACLSRCDVFGNLNDLAVNNAPVRPLHPRQVLHLKQRGPRDVVEQAGALHSPIPSFTTSRYQNLMNRKLAGKMGCGYVVCGYLVVATHCQELSRRCPREVFNPERITVGLVAGETVPVRGVQQHLAENSAGKQRPYLGERLVAPRPEALCCPEKTMRGRSLLHGH